MMYKIFVSSNQTELKEERSAVKEIVLGNPTLRNFFEVFLFEDTPAKGKSPVTSYLKEVDNSDIYIGIVGKEYGVKGKDGLSPTEREFRRFIKKPEKEAMIFIKGSDDSKKDIEVQAFIKAIRESYIYKRFTNPDGLSAHVLSSLISYLDGKGKLSKGPFDETICHETGYEAIDEKEVKDFLKNRAIKIKVDIPKLPVKDFLVNTLKVVKKEDGELRPTHAGLLFFGKDPTEYIPQNEIRIARFRGVSRIEFIDSQEIKGPFYKMLAEVESFFKRNTRLASKIVEFKRVDIPEYPYEAIREAVINAIAHRDYTRRGAPIIISIFDDRVEISNPGGLLPGLNIKNLEGRHESRNKKICSIFHHTLDMEQFGTGIKKMKRLTKEHGLSEPELREEGDFFVVRFYGPGDNILDLVPSIPKERQIDLRALGLNDRQIEALRLMVNERMVMTNTVYREKFKVSDRSALRDLYDLVKKGLVKRTGKRRAVEYQAT